VPKGQVNFRIGGANSDGPSGLQGHGEDEYGPRIKRSILKSKRQEEVEDKKYVNVDFFDWL